MTLVNTLKELARQKNITFAELERQLGFSNGQIRRWDNATPGVDKIQKVATYFNVSVDYLLGRESVDALYTHDGKLHDRIDVLLTAHNKTAEQVEKDLGFSVKSTSLSAGMLQAIADYFDASLDYLLGREIDTGNARIAEFHRVDISDLSDREKEEFEEEMKEMARFIQDRIRARRERFNKK